MILVYNLETGSAAEESIRKLCAKNKTLEDALNKKIVQILEFPQGFKPLHTPLQHQRRVHTLKSFVLTYEIIEITKTVKLIRFVHHDEAYR